jgi:hypothetical protein
MKERAGGRGGRGGRGRIFSSGNNLKNLSLNFDNNLENLRLVHPMSKSTLDQFTSIAKCIKMFYTWLPTLAYDSVYYFRHNTKSHGQRHA